MSKIKLPSWENLPSREEVLRRLTDKWTVQEQTETVPLEAAVNRICAGDMPSLVTVPVVRASMGDGIAVDSARFAGGIPDTSGWRQGVDFVRADTGDDFADAFDAVIMIEDVDLTVDGRVTIHPGVEVFPGSMVRGAGSTVGQGDVLARRHQPLRPRDLAGLAMGGYTRVAVLKKPVVAFVPTGSELVPPGVPLQRGNVYDSNSLLAKLSLESLGAEVYNYPIIKDQPQMLELALEKALQEADIVVLNGGSSKGEEDWNARLLQRKGEVVCHGAAAAPGKPLCAAIVDGRPVINLPGPFIGAYHGMEWCLNGLISHFLGQPPRRRPTVTATLTAPMRVVPDVSFLYVMEVSRKQDGSGYWVTPLSFKEIPMWRTIATNAQYMTPLGGESQAAGSEIEVELLYSPELIPTE